MEKACASMLKLDSLVSYEYSDVNQWENEVRHDGKEKGKRIVMGGSRDRLSGALHLADSKKQRRISSGRGLDGVPV